VTAPALVQPAGDGDRFCHEALFHDGDAEFMAGAVPFIENGLAGDDAVLVLVSAAKIVLLREALGAAAERIYLADMGKVGRNPTRIISAWIGLMADHAAIGRRIRAIGEPVWPGRSQAELDECLHHESLLNLAFAGWPALWLLCPYDTGALATTVVDGARCTHPTVQRRGSRRRSLAYRGLDGARDTLDGALPEPPQATVQVRVDQHRLADVRRLVADRAVAAGFGRLRVQDAVLAVSELATNTVRHGGGTGELRVWRDGAALALEVSDTGHIREPLVGRLPPAPGQLGGRGLWLVNELCDLVQLRSSESGTVVRVSLMPR
jgi:anti-sigma regulatory factor (Ser/Thr protein kinase)